VLARRQPGSTLKPFVYGLAFEQRLITPASLLDDSPAEIPTAAGLYLPQNYDRQFKGLVSARTALGASLNVPAVRVGAMLAPDALHARLNALGLDLPRSGGWYGASLALGSADVTLLALTNAYRALANGGLFTPPALPQGPTAPVRRVASAAATHLVVDILADNNARVRTFRLRQPAAHTRLCGGEDRHQQGHARQLVRRLHRPLHRRRVGRQRQRRADARRERHQWRRTGVAGAGAAPAP
jgi:penicillin-binding protein 1C